MNRRSPRAPICLLVVFICLGIAASPAAADQRYIVRTQPVVGLLGTVVDGLQIVTSACSVAGCTVQYGLGDNLNRLFLVTTADGVDPLSFMSLMLSLTGIQHVEIDALVSTLSTAAEGAPPALLDAEPLGFFGTTVRGGYVRQPADSILGVTAAREQYGLTGLGVTVAVIDTGVDPNHPVLQPWLRQGYDFTRDWVGGSELSDIDQSIMWVVDGAACLVNQSTMAILDESTVAVLDDPQYRAFGHGTMVAGIVHLVAPQATILPLKAFRADGTGYTSDVLRAIYTAVRESAKVLNMSFSLTVPSPEMSRAIEHATSNGAVPVASVGNDGQWKIVYPAALSSVIGVASTTDYDVLSSFSNFGTEVAWIAAPGEGIVTTYPLGTYAAGWGTSFSTPFAAGTAALLAQVSSQLNATHAATAEGNAVWISPEVSRGRLDIPAAVRAWRSMLGLE